MNVQNQRQYAIPADIRFHAGNHKWNASRGSVRFLYGVDHIFFFQGKNRQLQFPLSTMTLTVWNEFEKIVKNVIFPRAAILVADVGHCVGAARTRRSYGTGDDTFRDGFLLFVITIRAKAFRLRRAFVSRIIHHHPRASASLSWPASS